MYSIISALTTDDLKQYSFEISITVNMMVFEQKLYENFSKKFFSNLIIGNTASVKTKIIQCSLF